MSEMGEEAKDRCVRRCAFCLCANSFQVYDAVQGMKDITFKEWNGNGRD